MQGFVVERNAGWDCHGLPVETQVQKELGLDGPKEVAAYGVEPFNAACRRSVWRYEGVWEQLTERMGYWLDMSKDRVGISERRRTWVVEWIEKVLRGEEVVSDFDSGLG